MVVSKRIPIFAIEKLSHENFALVRAPAYVHPRVHIYNIDDLENERIIALVDNTPTRTRSRAIQTEIQALSDHTESAPSIQTAESDSNIISFDL